MNNNYRVRVADNSLQGRDGKDGRDRTAKKRQVDGGGPEMNIIVIADDLTGANGTAALLKREDLQSSVHLLGDPNAVIEWGRFVGEGAHVLDLNTRNTPGAVAQLRIRQVLDGLNQGLDSAEVLLGLRMDSTLRGPVADSIDALLDDTQLRVAIVVPAFPASGRTTVQAIHYLNGVPVDQTFVRRDPTSPVTSSDTRSWIGDKSRYESVHVSLERIHAGVQTVRKAFLEAVSQGARVVLCDAVTDGDVQTIATALVECLAEEPGYQWIPVDPGPLTAAVVRQMVRPRFLAPLVFGVSGSVMDSAKDQMDYLEQDFSTFVFHYEGQSLKEVVDAFSHIPSWIKAVVVRTDTYVPKTPADVQRLPDQVFAVVQASLQLFPSLRGFYLSGGETAGQLLKALGVTQLKLEAEVAPLTTLSQAVDGQLQGKWLVTKGGAVGDKTAVSNALARLYDVMAANHQPVTEEQLIKQELRKSV